MKENAATRPAEFAIPIINPSGINGKATLALSEKDSAVNIVLVSHIVKSLLDGGLKMLSVTRELDS